MPPDGFAAAMQGRLSFIAAGSRHRGVVAATLIVSQFRGDGMLLAVSLASLNAVPGDWRPRLTVLGQRLATGGGSQAQRFQLLHDAPPGLRLAGRWRAAQGVARLRGDVPGLRLAVMGTLLHGPAWRLTAAQIPWIGEWPGRDHAWLTLT